MCKGWVSGLRQEHKRMGLFLLAALHPGGETVRYRCDQCGRTLDQVKSKTFRQLKCECRECYNMKRGWFMTCRKPRPWKERILREDHRRMMARPMEELIKEAQRDAATLW